MAKSSLPPPLLKAIQHLFSQKITGCCLAGGTALAGFYAGHRRSDDLDFFTDSLSHQKAAVLAIKSLSKLGAKVQSLTSSNQYYEGMGELDHHAFKITSVVDENLFRVGSCEKVSSIAVASLNTLFKMKAATLVSRCSEKDLFDLIWLFDHFSERKITDLLQAGNEIDGGVSAEAMLASLEGATLRQEACDFSTNPEMSAAHVYEEILNFRRQMQFELVQFLKAEETPPLGKLVRKIKHLI